MKSLCDVFSVFRIVSCRNLGLVWRSKSSQLRSAHCSLCLRFMPGDDTSDEAWLTASRLHRLPSAHESGPGCGAVEQHSSVGLDQLHAHHVNNPAILHGIFGHLGPRDLCVVSATCQLWRKLNQDKAANGVWKRFYTSRWRVLGCSSQEDVCWQTKYGSKMKQVRLRDVIGRPGERQLVRREAVAHNNAQVCLVTGPSTCGHVALGL